jgi:hypothetical protein
MQYAVDPSNHVLILHTAAHALHTTLTSVARGIGISRRTMTRWMGNRQCMSPVRLHDLARLVHPADPAVAAQIAAVGGTTLVALGLEAPAAAVPAVDPRRHLVDAIVCAAAEALDASPRAVRPALVAAIRRTRETGLTLADVESLLAEPVPLRPA